MKSATHNVLRYTIFARNFSPIFCYANCVGVKSFPGLLLDEIKINNSTYFLQNYAVLQLPKVKKVNVEDCELKY